VDARDALPYRSEIGRHRLELRQFGRKGGGRGRGFRYTPGVDFSTHKRSIFIESLIIYELLAS
jgi:hypothetical protein